MGSRGAFFTKNSGLQIFSYLSTDRLDQGSACYSRHYMGRLSLYCIIMTFNDPIQETF